MGSEAKDENQYRNDGLLDDSDMRLCIAILTLTELIS